MDGLEISSTFASMDSVSRTVVTSMGWEREARLWQIIRLWKEIFKDPIARVSYPASLVDRELVVGCSSALWKRELTYLLPEIRNKLRESHPELSAIEITFRVVRPFSPPLRERSLPELSPETVNDLWNRAGEIAARLPDPLRDKGRLFVLRQLMNGLSLSSSQVKKAHS